MISQKILRAASLLFFCLLLGYVVYAQREEPRFDFYARGPYRESVPRPQAVTRFDVGDFHTNYATMERVVEKIAQVATDRVRVLDIGETNEHRMMHLIAISSPENIRRLDQIKANMARLADPRSTTPAQAEQIISETPVVVWLAYTIHGNESSSFEAMMQVVYQLAASNEPATESILKNCLVLVVPGENPDGHERFVTWYNSFGLGNPDPLASEHREPWSIWGRANHFRFDLNRDNIASTQAETRNMERAFLEWNPQVAVDHHGQPSQFFFPPASLPINPNLPRQQADRWMTTFGRANAAQFDAHNWDYYVRDIFDLYYPGYWDSWPSLTGATGMTYETDGGGFKGYNWRRDDGTIVTLRSSIAKHYVASMTTLQTAADNREARLRDYYDFKRTAIEEGRAGRMKRVVLVPNGDLPRAVDLVNVLLRAGIEVKASRAPFRSAAAHDYSGPNSSASAKSFQSGAFVIDMAQPQKRLAKALLEPNTEEDAAFVREQLARFARNQLRSQSVSREDYGFYDVTAWSLPLVFGVEAYWTEDAQDFENVELRLERPGEDNLSPNRPALPAGALPPERLLADAYNIGVVGGRASVAYIIPYDRNASAALAYRLQREGFHLAVATRTLNAGGRDWPRGTLIARVSRNPESLHEAIARLARETRALAWAVNSGFNESGDTGIGSENVNSLKKPNIIVAADDGVDQTSYGALWWTLDQAGVDFTPMTINNIKSGDIDRFNVIILPDGSPGRYFSAFGKGGIDTLRAWIERGGTLVCIKGAAVFAALKDVNLTSSRLVGSDEDSQAGQSGDEAQPNSSPSPSPTPNEMSAATAPQRKTRRAQTQTATEQQQTEANEAERLAGAPPILPPLASPSARPDRVPEGVPGAILRATVDRTTFLTYGYDDPSLPVLVSSGYFFRPSREGTNAIVFTGTGSLLVSGFVWPNTERLLRNTSYLIEEPTGRGHVVVFAEDPNFRGFWRSTTRLFFNSFLFSPSF
ncbi:MAG TPA: M14 family zinc carboxypeptidase [Pyrinomonadaceae bacterium]|nr:M14 family zinc carboxypeptidase [Pyrinomonadaceae bacterium]